MWYTYIIEERKRKPLKNRKVVFYMEYIMILKKMQAAMERILNSNSSPWETETAFGYLRYCIDYNDITIESLARIFLARADKRERVLVRVKDEIEDLS